jgi:hypothetical protein
MTTKKKSVLLVLMFCGLAAPGGAKKEISARRGKVETTDHGVAVLWREPSNIASRDLFYGQGGVNRQPHGRFTFGKEDLEGSNPKFTVTDSDGVKWKVKLGSETRPETAASRLVWAAGYSTDEDYFMARLRVENMTTPLHRGRKLMAPDGSFPNVRLKREGKDREKLGNWRWRDNPFNGTRELNGLRVLMALINNWDLKDSNTAMYRRKDGEDGSPESVYVVSDLGASFGGIGLQPDRSKEKGNLNLYRHSRFITSLTTESVSFATPGRATIWAIFNPHEYFSRWGIRRIGRDIPRSDAQWMGQVLSRLSHQQLCDAFRAAGYSPEEVEGFTQVLERRITRLNRLLED